MAPIGVRAESDDFRKYLGAPCHGVFSLLKYERGGAVAYHKPVPVRIERTWRALRRIVAARSREQGIEHGDLRGTELLGAACDHHVLAAKRDRLVRFAYGKRSGSARRAGRQKPSGCSERFTVHVCVIIFMYVELVTLRTSLPTSME